MRRPAFNPRDAAIVLPRATARKLVAEYKQEGEATSSHFEETPAEATGGDGMREVSGRLLEK